MERTIPRNSYVTDSAWRWKHLASSRVGLSDRRIGRRSAWRTKEVLMMHSVFNPVPIPAGSNVSKQFSNRWNLLGNGCLNAS